MSETATAGGTPGTTPAAAYPSAGRAWYMVSLLTIAYVVSFVDRSILGC